MVVVSSSTWWVGFVVAESSSQSLSGDSLFGSVLGSERALPSTSRGREGRGEGRRGKVWETAGVCSVGWLANRGIIESVPNSKGCFFVVVKLGTNKQREKPTHSHTYTRTHTIWREIARVHFYHPVPRPTSEQDPTREQA